MRLDWGPRPRSTKTRHPLSLSRLNYQWLACEGHPEMMEGVAARHLCSQRGLKGWNEALQRIHSHTGDSLEHGQAGLQASARSTSQRGGLLALEASWTINRDKLKYTRELLFSSHKGASATPICRGDRTIKRPFPPPVCAHPVVHAPPPAVPPARW